MRPGLIVQRDAGSSLLRYGMPAYLPAGLLRHIPLLPLDRDLVVPLVHTDDVADAVARVLRQRATGAFNLAADPPVTRDLIADVLGPARSTCHTGCCAPLWTWPGGPGCSRWTRGWIDLAFAVPLLTAHGHALSSAGHRRSTRGPRWPRSSPAWPTAPPPPARRCADAQSAANLPRSPDAARSSNAHCPDRPRFPWRHPCWSRPFPTSRPSRGRSARAAAGPWAPATATTSRCPAATATSSPTSARQRWTPTAAWSAPGIPAATTCAPEPWWTDHRVSCLPRAHPRLQRARAGLRKHLRLRVGRVVRRAGRITVQKIR
jgi:hypothetical protein